MQTYIILTNVNTWENFSNNATLDSLEHIHDKIHVKIGGQSGHMGDAAVAGIVDLVFSFHPERSFRVSLRSYLLFASYQC